MLLIKKKTFLFVRLNLKRTTILNFLNPDFKKSSMQRISFEEYLSKLSATNLHIDTSNINSHSIGIYQKSYYSCKC